MDRERLDRWCARGVLFLVLAALLYAPLATGALRIQEFIVVQWLIVAASALWLVRFWVNPKHRLLWPEVCWGVALLMIYAVARYYKADIEIVAREEMNKVLVYGVLFFLILANLHRLETIQIIGLALIFVAAAISLYALVQFLTGSDRVWHFIRPAVFSKRGSGTFICPNHMAGFLELILPLSLAYTLTGRFNYLMKIFLGYASLMIFTGIVVSISRGAWIASGITLVFFFFWMLRQRDYRIQSAAVLGAVIAVTAAFLFKAELSDNRREGLSLAGRTEDLRFRLWPTATEMWKDNIWWGVGPAHFDFRFRQYRPIHDQFQWRPMRVHNDYLNTLTDWGLVGAVLVGLPWLLFFWRVVASWRFFQRTPNDLGNTKRSNKSSFVLGACLGLVAILLHSFVDFNMHIPANAMVTVALMALVASHFRFASERYWVTLRTPSRILVTLVLLGLIGYLGYQAARRSVEQYWLAQARKIKSYSPQRTEALEKAFAAENKNPKTAYELGETFRMLSWQGTENYRELAERALPWFQRSMDLDRWEPSSRVKYGMCLDWIGEQQKAEPYFLQAGKLDPNGYLTSAHIGWHYFQTEDYATARKWFKKSLEIYWTDNPIAVSYLRIIDERLPKTGSVSSK